MIPFAEICCYNKSEQWKYRSWNYYANKENRFWTFLTVFPWFLITLNTILHTYNHQYYKHRILSLKFTIKFRYKTENTNLDCTGWTRESQHGNCTRKTRIHEEEVKVCKWNLFTFKYSTAQLPLFHYLLRLKFPLKTYYSPPKVFQFFNIQYLDYPYYITSHYFNYPLKLTIIHTRFHRFQFELFCSKLKISFFFSRTSPNARLPSSKERPRNTTFLAQLNIFHSLLVLNKY